MVSAWVLVVVRVVTALRRAVNKIGRVGSFNMVGSLSFHICYTVMLR